MAADRLKGTFVGREGVRAGWRLLLVFVLYRAVDCATHPLRPLPPRLDPSALTPSLLMVLKTLPLLVIVVTTVIAAKAERRTVGAYGVPIARGALRQLALGAAWGAGMLTVLLGAMLPLHGIAFTPSALGAGDLAGHALAWAAAYAVLALQEELLFRGYLQHTLANGIGFWPASVLSTLLFAAAHLGNPGETAIGITGVVAIGLLFCLFLRKTGSLWFPIGFHWAWDYCESFVYGVPNSGIVVRGRLLEARLDGPAWLTGGSAGPEGNYLALALIAGAAAFFALRPTPTERD